MLKSLITVPLLLVGSAVAAPGGPWGNWGNWGGNYGQQCVSNATVQSLIASYTYLLRFPQGADFNKTAAAILSDTQFSVTSDSINTLAQIPVRLLFPILFS